MHTFVQMHVLQNSISQVAAARRRPVPVVCGERHGHACDLIILRTDTIAGVPSGTTQRLVTRVVNALPYTTRLHDH